MRGVVIPIQEFAISNSLFSAVHSFRHLPYYLTHVNRGIEGAAGELRVYLFFYFCALHDTYEY